MRAKRRLRRLPVLEEVPTGKRFGTRGEIYGLSKAAAKRLRIRLASVEWGAHPALFVTLTYHDDYSLDWRDWKADLEAFQMRLKRYLGTDFVGYLWVQEFQRRGAPHFHLVLWVGEKIEGWGLCCFRRWASLAWNDIAGDGVVGDERDWQHLWHGVHVERVYNRQGSDRVRLMKYVSKYMTKSGGALPVDRRTGEVMATGRCWGVVGDAPIVEGEVYEVSYDAVIALCRRLRRWGKGRSWYLDKLSVSWNGWLVFGHGEMLEQLMAGLDMRPT